MAKNNKVKVFLLLGMSIILFIIFSRCRMLNKNNEAKLSAGIFEFYQTGKIYNAFVDLYIERDYFINNKLHNGNFSEKLSHWATTGTENFVPRSTKNKFIITDKEYVSAPYSLKICALEYPCRLFYTKDGNVNFLENPWNYQKSNIFLGVTSNKHLKVSMYYKGEGPTITINFLDRARGAFRILQKKVVDKISSDWEKVELTSIIPENGRAIFLEIQVYSLKPQAITYLDDIEMGLSDQEDEKKKDI